MLPRLNYAFAGTASDLEPLHDHLDQVLSKVESEWLGGEIAHHIGGEAVGGTSPSRAIASPIDNRLRIYSLRDGDADVVEQAYRAAHGACNNWRRTSWPERVRIVRAAASLLEDQRHEIGALLLLEIGKSRAEAMGEAEEAIAMLRYYCDEMEVNSGWERALRVQVRGEATYNSMRPYGVLSVVSPFNFPLALSSSMISAALLAGNTIVHKPNDQNSLTALKFARAMEDAGLPPGVLNVVLGGREEGRLVVEHPACDGVAFTGSHAVGMGIVRAFSAGPYVRPVIAEMGGKNPAVICASADLELAVSGVAGASFALQGQKCSACSRAYVHEDLLPRFAAALAERAASLAIGDPRNRDTYLGPLVNEAAYTRYVRAVDLAKRDGLVVGGGSSRRDSELAFGYYVEPTVVTQLPATHSLLRDELFVPFIALVPFRDLAVAMQQANDTGYGLSAGVYSKDPAELDVFFDTIQAGITYANRPSSATTGAWPGSQSFSGWKGSGTTGKGGLGPNYVPQFMREQSRTVRL